MAAAERPAAVLPGDDLDMSSGLVLLLERLCDGLAEGALVEVTSREPSVAHDLPAWCRFSGHRFEGLVEPGRYRFRRGRARRLLLDPALAAPADAPPPARADRRTGFAPRGARVEAGAPPYPFSLVERGAVWADEIGELYRHAVENQWCAARDVAWAELRPAAPEIEAALAQIFTFLAENELSALYTPARHLARIHPYYAEVAMFIATQLADEARHIEAFLRRARAGGQALGASTASSQASLRTLLEQEDFTAASFLLSVLGEGTFLDLLRFIEEHAPDPVTADVVRRARADEARHVRFGVAHVRQHLAGDPAAATALAAAARDRARALAGVTDVSPLVQESLAILAAGSVRPAAIRRGVAATRELRATMHGNRVKRLVACGFSPADAEALSTLHTPNFM